MVKAQAKCPANKVQNKVCTFITKSDIVTLSGNRLSNMVNAEEILKLCHDMTEAATSAGSHMLCVGVCVCVCFYVEDLLFVLGY